jgi:hypothetical protein
LVLIAPRTNPDANIGSNWRSSTALHGTPGGSDTLGYADWKLMHSITSDDEDDDQDGYNALAEFALGTSPNVPSGNPPIKSAVVTVGGEEYATIEIRRSLAATDDVRLIVETSTALAAWTADAVYVSETHHEDGETATVTYRSPQPISASQRLFLRAKFIAR